MSVCDTDVGKYVSEFRFREWGNTAWVATARLVNNNLTCKNQHQINSYTYWALRSSHRLSIAASTSKALTAGLGGILGIHTHGLVTAFFEVRLRTLPLPPSSSWATKYLARLKDDQQGEHSTHQQPIHPTKQQRLLHVSV